MMESAASVWKHVHTDTYQNGQPVAAIRPKDTATNSAGRDPDAGGTGATVQDNELIYKNI